MKEKIWIEKLIELLNEYENQLDLKWCTRSEQPNFIWHIKAVSEYSDNILYNADLAVTSKRYWFIKWLVENDKIDFGKVQEKIWLERELYERMLYWYKEDDFLIMILSIENEPIRFLCEILK